MSRRLPRAFFWVDQRLIRSGVWLELSAQTRLAYIALAASCDREGLSIWSRNKLMELAACRDPDEWGFRLIELERHRLIEPVPGNCPPAIRLLELDPEASGSGGTPAPRPAASGLSSSPGAIVVQTTIHLGGKPDHAQS